MVPFSHNPDFLQRLSAGRQGEASGLRKKNSYETDTDIQRRHGRERHPEKLIRAPWGKWNGENSRNPKAMKRREEVKQTWEDIVIKTAQDQISSCAALGSIIVFYLWYKNSVVCMFCLWTLRVFLSIYFLPGAPQKPRFAAAWFFFTCSTIDDQQGVMYDWLEAVWREESRELISKSYILTSGGFDSQL